MKNKKFPEENRKNKSGKRKRYKEGYKSTELEKEASKDWPWWIPRKPWRKE